MKEEASVRVLTDKIDGGGTRTIVIIDSCGDQPIGEAVAALLAPLLAGQQNAAPNEKRKEEVKGLLPLSKPESIAPTASDIERMEAAAKGEQKTGAKSGAEPVISTGEYKGLKPAEALDRYRIKALAKLFDHAKGLPDCSEKTAIVRECRNFMSGKLPILAADATTRHDMTALIEDVAKIAPLDKLAQGYSFQDYKSLCRLGRDDEIKAFFDAVVQSLQDRGQRNG
jgi:hypothetical protein